MAASRDRGRRLPGRRESVVHIVRGLQRLRTADDGKNTKAAAASQQTQTFTVLLGPVLTRQQFFRASGSASVAKTSVNTQAAPFSFSWGIAAVDADWDDESGQVELRIETFVSASGTNNSAAINGFGFQVAILAAVAYTITKRSTGPLQLASQRGEAR
ncbi:MAG: hypothetical protein ABR568_21065 [Pyrinomonadaceae bacterium]